jgi:putative two-component system response regulator
LNPITPGAHPDTVPLHAAIAVMALAMATLAETRDSDTGQHVLRVQRYVRTLAQRLQAHPRFAAQLTETYLNHLFVSAPLYDVGTVGIPDRILLKPARLTAAEFEIMKTHTTLGFEAIGQAEQALGFKAELLQTLKEMAYSHHEKWDGSGYPQKLSGDQIPLSARLVAIADVYDALISNRVYKDGVPHDQAVAIIFQGRASHFDPDMVDAFIEIQDEFQAIAQRYPDTDQDMQKKIEYMANAIAEDAGG